MTEDTMADPVDDPDAAAPEPPKSDPVLVPEAEPEGPIADSHGDELEHGEPDHPETDPESETQSGEPA